MGATETDTGPDCSGHREDNMRYHAAIEMTDGRRLPIFASRHTTLFKSIDKAVRVMERKRIAGRGFVWPAGRTFADTPMSEVYTIAL